MEYNGKHFSSLAKQICYIVFVKQVEFIKPQNGTLFPPTDQLEIPTCPVCLERLDSSESGLLTVLCNHSFHCECLMRWKEESRCPVCRYCQQPSGSKSQCRVCGTTDGLWICLVCGHVGCGRYVDCHARDHYKQTMHTYALELESQRVWDYAGDGYVHRLIQKQNRWQISRIPRS